MTGVSGRLRVAGWAGLTQLPRRSGGWKLLLTLLDDGGLQLSQPDRAVGGVQGAGQRRQHPLGDGSRRDEGSRVPAASDGRKRCRRCGRRMLMKLVLMQDGTGMRSWLRRCRRR